MYELKVITHLAAAHQLNETGGKCEKLHGHNWKIEVYVSGPCLDATGLLIDFQLVKKAVAQVIEDLDHTFLNELTLFKDLNPSSENIARIVYEKVGQTINSDRVRVNKVTAWESDTAGASYSEP
ncbi:MAG: 6-carboxytetrahydropterin synthase QueD [Desulfobacteraceae bacterium]|nr:MAG: 6-carboxytetrahydropterin synthase QueD [Desulfobacteraceae bacterium]